MTDKSMFTDFFQSILKLLENFNMKMLVWLIIIHIMAYFFPKLELLEDLPNSPPNDFNNSFYYTFSTLAQSIAGIYAVLGTLHLFQLQYNRANIEETVHEIFKSKLAKKVDFINFVKGQVTLDEEIIQLLEYLDNFNRNNPDEPIQNMTYYNNKKEYLKEALTIHINLTTSIKEISFISIYLIFVSIITLFFSTKIIDNWHYLQSAVFLCVFLIGVFCIYCFQSIKGIFYSNIKKKGNKFTYSNT